MVYADAPAVTCRVAHPANTISPNNTARVATTNHRHNFSFSKTF